MVRVTAGGVTLHQLGYETFWHIPHVALLDWQGTDGTWRQAHGIRTCDVLALTPRPTIGPSCAGFPERAKGVPLDRPLSVISGGGRFYAFYIEDWHFQTPNYRHLLINGSRSMVSMYHINPDGAFGDAAVEVRNSTGTCAAHLFQRTLVPPHEGLNCCVETPRGHIVMISLGVGKHVESGAPHVCY
eukprot:m.1296769 g.1296769  ORF g.1296769 m.1296769 type:complete len:186 (+) comp24795_c0_seq7:1624-2181(+)